MEYLYGSLEGRCSEAVCRPVRVLEIRNGHVSSSGYREKTEVGAFLWEMSAEVLFCCFLLHIHRLRWCFGKGTQSPAIAHLLKEGNVPLSF